MSSMMLSVLKPLYGHIRAAVAILVEAHAIDVEQSPLIFFSLDKIHFSPGLRKMISIKKCEAISNFRRLHDGLDRLERIHDIEGGYLEVDATVEDRRLGNPCA